MPTKKEIIVVGDRVLISLDKNQNRTEFGLYLPPGVKEKEKVRGGYVVKVGPGYPMPDLNAVNDEPWSPAPKSRHKYIPLQAQIGDYAIFLSGSAVEIEFEGKEYVVVSQSSILVLVRDEFTDLEVED
ncbi:MAG: co-chaperone GroES [bacterium]